MEEAACGIVDDDDDGVGDANHLTRVMRKQSLPLVLPRPCGGHFGWRRRRSLLSLFRLS